MVEVVNRGRCHVPLTLNLWQVGREGMHILKANFFININIFFITINYFYII